MVDFWKDKDACWKLMDCPGYVYKKCPAYFNPERPTLGVAKVHGKVDPADFKSVVSFLVRRIIDKRLRGDLFASSGRIRKRVRKGKRGNRVSRRETRRTAG